VPLFQVTFSGSQASVVGRSLYQLDLEARRATALLENSAEYWTGPIPASRGGLEFTSARSGSWEVFGQAYGATEQWFSGHPIALWTQLQDFRRHLNETEAGVLRHAELQLVTGTITTLSPLSVDCYVFGREYPAS
jgi:hypothetical protein